MFAKWDLPGATFFCGGWQIAGYFSVFRDRLRSSAPSSAGEGCIGVGGPPRKLSMASMRASSRRRWKQRNSNKATRIAGKIMPPSMCPMLASSYHVLGVARRVSRSTAQMYRDFNVKDLWSDSYAVRSGCCAKSSRIETRRGPWSLPEQCFEMASSMHHAENKNLLTIDAIEDDVLPHGGAARAGTEIFIAGSSQIGEAGQRKRKRLVIASIRRVATSMLPLSLAV